MMNARQETQPLYFLCIIDEWLLVGLEKKEIRVMITEDQLTRAVLSLREGNFFFFIPGVDNSTCAFWGFAVF